MSGKKSTNQGFGDSNASTTSSISKRQTPSPSSTIGKKSPITTKSRSSPKTTTGVSNVQTNKKSSLLSTGRASRIIVSTEPNSSLSTTSMSLEHGVQDGPRLSSAQTSKTDGKEENLRWLAASQVEALSASSIQRQGFNLDDNSKADISDMIRSQKEQQGQNHFQSSHETNLSLLDQSGQSSPTQQRISPCANTIPGQYLVNPTNFPSQHYYASAVYLDGTTSGLGSDEIEMQHEETDRKDEKVAQYCTEHKRMIDYRAGLSEAEVFATVDGEAQYTKTLVEREVGPVTDVQLSSDASLSMIAPQPQQVDKDNNSRFGPTVCSFEPDFSGGTVSEPDLSGGTVLRVGGSSSPSRPSIRDRHSMDSHLFQAIGSKVNEVIRSSVQSSFLSQIINPNQVIIY